MTDRREAPDEPEELPIPHASPVVSVVIPVLNEAQTVGGIVRLVREDHNVLEVLVVDDGSIDGTAEAATEAGAKVMMSSLLGKGASIADGVAASRGDIVVFVDGDIREIDPHFVAKLARPILAGEADLVKAGFTRDTGRVTVLTARPLLEAFFPELASFHQPIGGIVAAKRSLLSTVKLENDWGVDVGLLIDAVARGARAVEVDIGRIDHDSQPLEALGEMAKQVSRVILDRAWKYERLSINHVSEMHELERRASAELLPLGATAEDSTKVALLDMDGVLLDGRFVTQLAERVGVTSDLALFLDNKFLPDDERAKTIAALFTGVRWEVFEEIALSMPLMQGAVETVVALRKAGYRVGIVTDSFHVAAEIVRRRVFADFCVANVLHFKNHAATGELTPSPFVTFAPGCPRHTRCKSNVVRRIRAAASLDALNVLAVGDGENDACMLREADVSIAFRPTSALLEEAATHTVRGSLLEIVALLGEEGSKPLPCSGATQSPSPEAGELIPAGPATGNGSS